MEEMKPDNESLSSMTPAAPSSGGLSARATSLSVASTGWQAFTSMPGWWTPDRLGGANGPHQAATPEEMPNWLPAPGQLQMNDDESATTNVSSRSRATGDSAATAELPIPPRRRYPRHRRPGLRRRSSSTPRGRRIRPPVVADFDGSASSLSAPPRRRLWLWAPVFVRDRSLRRRRAGGQLLCRGDFDWPCGISTSHELEPGHADIRLR